MKEEQMEVLTGKRVTLRVCENQLDPYRLRVYLCL